MKVKKSVIKAIALSLAVGITATACEKEKLEDVKDKMQDVKEKIFIKKKNVSNCPGCGMG